MVILSEFGYWSSILKTGNDRFQPNQSLDASPALNSTLRQRDDHRQVGQVDVVCATAMPQVLRKRTIARMGPMDAIAGSNFRSALGCDVVEREQHVSILRQAFHHLMCGLIAPQRAISGLVRPLAVEPRRDIV